MQAHGQIRWIDLSEEQKKEVRRMRNAESARKHRLKKKMRGPSKDLEDEYMDNERRIDELEKMVSSMNSTLKSGGSRKAGLSGSSRPGSCSSTSSSAVSRRPSQYREERPEWFGEPF